MRYGCGLKTLNLDDNQFGDETGEEFMKAITFNTSIESISFDKNPMSLMY